MLGRQRVIGFQLAIRVDGENGATVVTLAGLIDNTQPNTTVRSVRHEFQNRGLLFNLPLAIEYFKLHVTVFRLGLGNRAQNALRNTLGALTPIVDRHPLKGLKITSELLRAF